MTAQIIVLSDHRAAKARQAPKRAALRSGELYVGVTYLAALAWVSAMEDAAALFMVPWPGGIDDLKF